MREMVQLVKRATRVEGDLKIGDNTEPRQGPEVPRSTGSFPETPGNSAGNFEPFSPGPRSRCQTLNQIGAKRDDSAILALSQSGRQIDISARECTGNGRNHVTLLLRPTGAWPVFNTESSSQF